ncbi:hypothetical protein [Cyanobium sp. CH-040]|uniref:hypothetical protein n=1 Tax=Cyanobium sp. CH-040 TaxID=2823708 RepID=UPI0020CDFAAE|nr:hypothetical protein [Cyanobium sp. CH-040]MCP9927756.1 hypothetical protein [Cyanobium sp. CH-040]
MSKDIITGRWSADGNKGRWKVRADGETFRGFYAYTQINRFKGIAKAPLIYDANRNRRLDARDFVIGRFRADLDDLINKIPPSASGSFSINLETDRLKLFYNGNRFGSGIVFDADSFFS